MAIQIQGLCPLIQVFDMPTSLRFYRDVLGFEVGQDSGKGDSSDWVWLRSGDADFMLNTAYESDSRPETAPVEQVKWHQDTCLYLRCQDLDGAYAHLVANGVDAKPPVTQAYGMRQVYFSDPDGYQLCFQWRA